MARTERESDRRIKEEKWQTFWCCRVQQRACRMAHASAENLEHTEPAKLERMASVPQREQLERAPEPPLPKKKRNRAVCSKYQIIRERKSRWVRAAPWRVRGISEPEYEEKKVDFTVIEGRFQE